MRNIKMLGLLAVSAMASAALIGASPASGAYFTAEFKAGSTLSTSLVENHVFTVEGSKVECEEIGFEGFVESNQAQSQVVYPSYKKCKAFGFANATVKPSSALCRFEFRAATDGAGMATVRLFGCLEAETKGIQIEVNIPFIAKCLVDVPEQSVASAVGYSNPTGTSVRVKATATGIMNDVTTSTGACPLKVGTNSTGAYTGASDVTAPGGYQYDS